MADSRSNQGGTVPAGAPVGIMGACDSALPRLASASRWFRSSGVLGSGRPACGIRSPRPPKPSTYLSFDIVRVRSPGVCRTHASPVRRVSAARRRTRCPAPCCRRVLGRLSGRRGCRRRRRWPTGIYRAGVPGLSHLRCAGARLRSSAVRGVRVRAARAVLVQGPRLLPQLRRAAHE